MALCGKVDNCVKLLFFKKSVDGFSIGYVAENKAEAVASRLVKRVKIAGISECVKAHEPVIGVLSLHIVYKITAYKTGASGDKYIFCHNFFPFG